MTLKVFELSGTARFLGFGPGTTSDPYIANGLDPSIEYEMVDYPAESFPMSTSAATGVTNLTSRINAWTGEFVLVGYSQGAGVISAVYDLIRSGSLAGRNSDLLCGITFGNIKRQAGHTFPGGTDPGGHGIAADRLTGSETRWWDFANPGDPAASTFDDSVGSWQTTLFEAVWTAWDGSSSSLASTVVANAPSLRDFSAIPKALGNIVAGVFVPGAPHGAYGTVKPIEGDTRSSQKIALDHINSLV